MSPAGTAPDDCSPPRARDHVAIFLVSCSLLVFQIALTRVLSVVVWYHFAFLTISLVMLGLGAPGVWFAMLRRPQRWLVPSLVASGVTVPVAVALIVAHGTSFLLDGATVLIVLCVLPATLALGSAVCLLLMKARGAAIQRMYGIDLIGACLGAVAIIPLLHTIPTPQLAAGCGLLPLAAASLYGGAARATAAVLAAAVLAVVVGTPWLHVTRSKSNEEALVAPVFEKWTPTARLTVFDDRLLQQREHNTGFSWGRGSKYPVDQPQVQQYWLEQDASAGTPITKFDGDLTRLTYLDYDVTTLGYQLRAPARAAIIGAGGGRDILSALRAGATAVDAIELNPHTIELVSATFGHVSGDVYHQPGVRAIASEGRSHLTHTAERYDSIQISLIDSWAASAAGAFALAENNLYTLEAYRLYFDRLTGGGVLSTSRWLGEVPRLLLLGRAALAAAGIAAPEQHMMLVAAGGIATVLIGRTAFTADDLERVRTISEQRGFVILYPPQPDHAGNAGLVDVIAGRTAVLAANGLVVDSPTDDSPYFFHVVSPFADVELLKRDAVELLGVSANWSSVVVLRQAMLLVSLLAALLFLLPFAWRAFGRRTSGPLSSTWGTLLRSSLYFAAIGAGFMLLENMLVQHFVLYLGHPSYATTVIIASLLFGMGIGAMKAGGFGIARLVRRGWLVPLAIAAVVSLLPPLFAATLGVPLGLRIALAGAILVPLGMALGTFFPLGMQRFGDADKPWLWSINGVFGVVASVMSLALSMQFGFRFVGLLSATIYLGAWLCLAPGRR